MVQKQTNFKDRLAFGEEGEHIISEFLIEKGVLVMPLYQFNNDKTPIILGKETNFISPDLLCYGKEAFFVEVKTKNRWVHWKGGLETGFNEKHYNHYMDVMKNTNQNVFVIFRHIVEKPTGIFLIKLDSKPTRYWNGKTPQGKYIDKPFIFYPYESLKKIE